MAMRNRMENISNAKSKQTKIRKKWVIVSNSSSKWSKQVPDDIMQSVLQRLSIFDYFRCRSVCRSWRDSVDRAISSKRCRPAPQLPWLFCSRDRNFLSYCDRVMLPPCKHELTAASFISKLVASSVPSSPSLPCTCIVACLSRVIEKTWLGVCRPTDKSWTRIDEEVLNFESIEFIDGKLYAATKNLSQFLLVYQFDTNDDQQLHYTARRLVVHDDTPRLPDRERFDYIFRIKKSHLSLAKDFSTSKELIMITFPDDHTVNLLVCPPNYAEAFQVFKLEFSNNKNKNKNDAPPLGRDCRDS
ncbi:PREDICTED: F-box only 6 isoform [Prunus dulcis]|uniref:PREDICTED: F-box only 6 isoform n=1 Tax=Prunus dulcis TaxID=3755 RepID=A0A5E4EYS3_PRUDU|nr:PREDICTED: F-box only 6 isoform [Prunus dulcis]